MIDLDDLCNLAKMDDVNLICKMDNVNMKEKSHRSAGQKHGNLKAALIQEALSLLDEQGIESVTIREVARRAGVAHSAPANHFPSRGAMLTAIAATTFTDLAHLTAAMVSATADKPESAMEAFAAVWFQFAFDFPHRYQLLWRRELVDQDDPALAKAMDDVYSQVLALLQPGLGNCRVDAETNAIAMWSMIHGYISLRLDGNLVAATDKVSGLPREKAILRSLIDGIGCSGDCQAAGEYVQPGHVQE
jgi:AcrR family transcriptional regulator